MLKIIIPFIIVFTVIYLLYMNGLIPITVKSAVMFIGSSGCKKASFTSCNGYIKRIVKLEGDRVYNFTLLSKLTAGSMTVELIDKSKQTVLQLNEIKNSESLVTQKVMRYTLIIRFHSASGQYELNWR